MENKEVVERLDLFLQVGLDLFKGTQFTLKEIIGGKDTHSFLGDRLSGEDRDASYSGYPCVKFTYSCGFSRLTVPFYCRPDQTERRFFVKYVDEENLETKVMSFHF